MKVFKKSIAAVLAAAITAAGTTCLPAMADDTATILTKIEYDNETGDVKAMIYISNFEPIANCGFYISLGDGFVFERDDVFDGTIHYKCQKNSYTTYGAVFLREYEYGSSAFVFNARADNRNPNGLFLEIYLEETSVATPQNSTVNVTLDYFANVEDTINYTSANTDVPVMQKAVKYVKGDANGDGAVTSADYTALLHGLSIGPNQFNVSDIETTYTQYFPNAKDAYALDVNDDGKVSFADAAAISQCIGWGIDSELNTIGVGNTFYHCYYV